MVLLGLGFFLGGLGLQWIWTLRLGLGIGLVVVLQIWLGKRRVELPSGAWLYVLFVLWLVLSGFLGSGWAMSKKWVYLFFNLGVYWVVGYNLGEDFLKRVVGFGVGLGGLFLLMYGAYELFGLVVDNCSWSFLCWAREDHHHLGDWWAVFLVGWVGKKIKKKKVIWGEWVIGGVGGLVVLVSQSRSAYFTVFVGLLWVMLAEEMGEKRRVWLRRFLWGVMGAVFILSTWKESFYARSYFVQALWGWWRYPLMGIGMGNFQAISRLFAERFGVMNVSSLAHSLWLEILVGGGVLGLAVFLWWLVGRLRRVFVSHKEVVGQAMLLALLANFAFDYTYVMLPMIGFFGILLGVLENAPID